MIITSSCIMNNLWYLYNQCIIIWLNYTMFKLLFNLLLNIHDTCKASQCKKSTFIHVISEIISINLFFEQHYSVLGTHACFLYPYVLRKFLNDILYVNGYATSSAMRNTLVLSVIMISFVCIGTLSNFP